MIHRGEFYEKSIKSDINEYRTCFSFLYNILFISFENSFIFIIISVKCENKLHSLRTVSLRFV